MLNSGRSMKFFSSPSSPSLHPASYSIRTWSSILQLSLPNHVCFLFSPVCNTYCVLCPLFDQPNNNWQEVQLPIIHFASVMFVPQSQLSYSAPNSQHTLIHCLSLNVGKSSVTHTWNNRQNYRCVFIFLSSESKQQDKRF
jgi:hypothetical protein